MTSKRLYLCAFALLLTFASGTFAYPLEAFKKKDLHVYIACPTGLRDTPYKILCEEVVQGFFADYGSFFSRTTSPVGAEISLDLTDQAISGGPTLYTYSWRESAALSVSAFAYTVPIDPTQDRLTILNSIIANVKKGAALYLKVISDEVQSDGNAVIVYAPDGKPHTPSKFSQGPFYFDLSLNGSGSSAPLTKSQNGELDASANYSGNKVRIQIFSEYGLASQTVPADDGTSITGSHTWTSYAGIASYSLSHRWSVAVIASRDTDPGSNLLSRQSEAVGVEWSLVPFRTTESREIYFRAGSGLNDYRLDAENELGKTSDRMLYGFAQIYAYWSLLQSKMNISVQGKVTTYAGYSGYERYKASANLSYQITPSIRISGNYAYVYQQKSLNYPKNPDYSNPLKTMYLSGAPGASNQYSIGVGITLGNSIKRTRDRRWSGF